MQRRGGSDASLLFIPSAKPVPAAVLCRRSRRLDRAREHQGLRAWHGGRSHCGRSRAFCYSLALRRKARTQQFRQEPVLLSLHVWRRAARRPVLHQQSEGRWTEVHISRSRLQRTWTSACCGWRQTVRFAGRCCRRHACWLANHVGGDRFSRTGYHVRCRQAAGGHEAGGSNWHDRIVLRYHLYLGYRRHHPDLQVSSTLVGCRCESGSKEIRGRIRR